MSAAVEVQVETVAVAWVEMYRAMDANYSYTRQVWVGYNRACGEVVAATQGTPAWLRDYFRRRGSEWVQKHNVATSMFDSMCATGARLDQQARKVVAK